MKKAKDILTPNNLARFVMVLAILIALAAIIVVFRHGTTRSSVVANDEYRTTVVVASGDTLSGLLSKQGLGNNDVATIAKILKSDAGISTLRAKSDKIEFVRASDDAPVSKIVK
mgnify:CR=1 FL=1